MHRTHKIRLDLTCTQAQYCAQACGVARFAWNWALAEWTKQYTAHKLDRSLPKPSEGALRRQLNSLKREQYPWMLDVTKCAPQESIINLGIAFKNWFESLSGRRKGPKMRAPTFKKKGRRDSFKLSAGTFEVDGSRMRIPLLGWVRMREALRFSGKPVSVTVSRTAHCWFASITVDTDDLPPRCESQAAIGVDLGIHTLVALSSGQKDPGPKALAMMLNKLRRLSRAHSRKIKGSANRKKSARKLACLHMRIANLRNDRLHKLTTMLVTHYGFIAIEDLNVKGMFGFGSLARSLADAAFGEFRRQLEYKAKMTGAVIHAVDRFYPSSKTCSDCGHVHAGLTLADRVWICPVCGRVHDRDDNAAKNILAHALREMAAGVAVTACGEEGSGSCRKTGTKPASLKQEATHNITAAAML